jgi:site-specific recombinase XerD
MGYFRERSIKMGKKGIGSYIEDYLSFLSVERGLADSTINGYSGYLGEFFVEYKAGASVRVDEGTIRQYLGQKREQGRSGTSLGSVVASLRGYFKFLHREGLIDRDPAKIIEYPKREKKLPEYLSEKQVDDLLAIIEDPRDKAIAEVLYASGIRAGELLNLKNGDLNLEEKTLRIREAKNGRERVAYLNKPAVDALRRYKGLDWPEDPFFLEKNC